MAENTESAGAGARPSPIKRLLELGQSPWLDFIQRGLVTGGALERMIADWSLRGMTSNPAIFEKAIAQTHEYDGEVAALAASGVSAEQIYETIAVDDVRRAADVFLPVYEATAGADGFVSLEVSPHKANDAGETIAEAKRLWAALARPNVMLKVPGTEEGLTALRALLTEGINVNVTLLFSVKRYRDVLTAHLEGLEAAAATGRNLASIASVASFFVSRIDTLVDRELDRIIAAGGPDAATATGLRGEVAIASGRQAYAVFEEHVASPRFRRVAEQGARPQRLLWASTGTKDPAYSDVKYVEALIGPDTVNTMPLDTLRAYDDHGDPKPRLSGHLDEATATLASLEHLGIDLDALTAQLLREGIDKFVQPYDALLEILEIARQSTVRGKKEARGGASTRGARSKGERRTAPVRGRAPSDERYLLVLNAGSSSLKFEVFDCSGPLRSRAAGAVRDIGRPEAVLEVDGAAEVIGRVSGTGAATALILERSLGGLGGVKLSADNLAGTAHRVVHGGDAFSDPVRVTVSAFDKLKSLAPLAPLHIPPSLSVMEEVGERFPEVPIVAVFDTAFFRDLPEEVRTYAITRAWTERYSIRRFGFHGIAHQSLHEQLVAASGKRTAPDRTLTLHLGQGSSITALRGGRPVETSMGFTPLEGLIMGTRPGDVDAGVLLHVAQLGHGWKELDDALNRESGLLGLSGVSDDVRQLLELESRGHSDAALALRAYCHRIRKYIGAYAAVLGGLDAIAIGGGIGEHSRAIRERIFTGFEWLGIELDDTANRSATGRQSCISAPSSRVEVHVIPVDEESIIATAAAAVLSLHRAGSA